MELRRISVNNLFGILNYDIDLGNSETIIITGVVKMVLPI